MPIRERFENVLAGYIDACREPLAGHPMAEELRRQLPETLREILVSAGVDTNLTFQGSPGLGRWARIPWIAVFHPRETKSAMRGVYVVYLFAADMSAVYLTLNQGVTEATDEEIVAKSGSVQEVVGAVAGFDGGPLAQGTLIPPGRGGKPHGYEIGCIFHKSYTAGHLPTEQELQVDLVALVRTYVGYVEGCTITPDASTPVETLSRIATPSETPPSETDDAVSHSVSLELYDLRPRLIERVRELSPGAFERLLGELWRRLGYREVRVTGRTNDGGVDGDFTVPLVNVRVAFQAKRYSQGNNISGAVVRQLKGSVTGRFDLGIFVTTSAFTAGGTEEAEAGGARVVLIDADGLVDLLIDANLGIRLVVERADLDEDAFTGLET